MSGLFVPRTMTDLYEWLVSQNLRSSLSADHPMLAPLDYQAADRLIFPFVQLEVRARKHAKE